MRLGSARSLSRYIQHTLIPTAAQAFTLVLAICLSIGSPKPSAVFSVRRCRTMALSCKVLCHIEIVDVKRSIDLKLLLLRSRSCELRVCVSLDAC